MKYLLLDTNIFLNLVVNRRKDVNADLVSSFKKLLDFGEIRLIVPDIVIHETYKHLDDEIYKINVLLKEALKYIKKCYWVNGLVV